MKEVLDLQVLHSLEYQVVDVYIKYMAFLFNIISQHCYYKGSYILPVGRYLAQVF
jgi:hypothetical protein